MNGDKKSLGELIDTLNGAKVDPNVGEWILDNLWQIFPFTLISLLVFFKKDDSFTLWLF